MNLRIQICSRSRLPLSLVFITTYVEDYCGCLCININNLKLFTWLSCQRKKEKKSTFFTASNNHEHSKVEPHTQMSSKLHQYDLLKVTAVS